MGFLIKGRFRKIESTMDWMCRGETSERVNGCASAGKLLLSQRQWNLWHTQHKCSYLIPTTSRYAVNALMYSTSWCAHSHLGSQLQTCSCDTLFHCFNTEQYPHHCCIQSPIHILDFPRCAFCSTTRNTHQKTIIPTDALSSGIGHPLGHKIAHSICRHQQRGTQIVKN